MSSSSSASSSALPMLVPEATAKPEASTNPAASNNTADTTNPADNSKPASKRVRAVHTRALVDFTDPRELAQVMLDAVTAHKHLYEDAGILHGDINPNTIAIFAFPDGGGARSVGGLIDCDEPLRRVKV
ncbi:uncharacterized protein TRAVEDRAFT_24668 [Trametes versicolor FP-101664 SS1]|uniref:Fungal-type protein kinase domain-containing protein n=1 Tax=Trametes versicolor (strain FP-101664) TaxID=717944 RepID=R7S887_TRAVS|nr:uncharacterized protein TRAVEDRAFT_24668 [Trametes versicolor FP-101664 SS1]EIW51915.1 hypothetical protein TRAVEDRAFT_24668 [Trametes versicolor FP-101664 SS1]